MACRRRNLTSLSLNQTNHANTPIKFQTVDFSGYEFGQENRFTDVSTGKINWNFTDPLQLVRRQMAFSRESVAIELITSVIDIIL